MKNTKAISYKAIMNQIGQLTKQAEAVRKNEVANVIQRIQKEIKTFGITPQDLSFESTTSVRKVVHTRRKPVAKFKDPITGATWTGRGKTPKWMQAPLRKGATKEMFALNS